MQMKLSNHTVLISLALAMCVFVAVAGPIPKPAYCGIAPGTDRVLEIPPPKNGDDELIQVHTFIRHGDRTSEAAGCWPNDKGKWDCELTQTSVPSTRRSDGTLNTPFLFRRAYQNGSEPIPGTNCVQMQLTTRGYEQQMNNGAALRKAYINTGLLPGSYNASAMLLRADDMDRCMQSAEALVLGMYPSAAEVKDATVSSVPVIDIVTMGQMYQIFYPNNRLCPAAQDLNNQAQYTSAYSKFQQDTMWPLQQELATALNMPTSQTNVHLLWDCFFFHLCHDQDLPDTIDEDLFNKVNNAVLWGNKYINTYPNATVNGKFQIGLLLKDMFASMQQITGEAEAEGDVPRFVLYSGHDSTLMPVLYAYDVFDGTWTPFAGMINFEVYKSSSMSSGFGVRMLYDGTPQAIPGCESADMCDWKTFSQITADLIPTHDECFDTSFRYGRRW